MATEKKTDRDWDRHDWAGEDHPADEKSGARWADEKWAGETPKEGDKSKRTGGLSGGGHTPGEQHWTPDKKK
jgi:hypothetical protein